MKRTISHLAALLLCAPFFFTSCDYLENLLLPDLLEPVLGVSMDHSDIVFQKDEMSKQVGYTIIENSEDTCNISISELDYVTASVGSDAIVFTTKGGGDFNETATVTFDNGRKTQTFKVDLSRSAGAMTGDEEVKSYRFAEYARVFPIEIPDEYAILFSVPDEYKDWIFVQKGLSLEGKTTKNTLYVLITENVGSKERKGKVVINNLSTGKDIVVNITQLGSEMNGSLKKGLLDLYEATGGKNWFKRKGDTDSRELHWNRNMSLLDFYGITPARKTKASAIDPKNSAEVYFGTEDEWTIYLPFNGLKGTIPESFWDVCKYFTYISINRCYLQDSRLSDKVWHEKLVGIDFEHTYIGGELSSKIVNAKNLKVINFRLCHLSGEFPQDIAQLKELEKIDFSSCNLTGEFPNNIGMLSKLQMLNVSGNLHFGGTLPDSFYDLLSLKKFYASASQLGGTISPRIGEMKNLKDFYIDGCEFEGTIPEELGTLTRFVFCGENNYFTEIPEFVRYSGCQNRWILMGGTFPSGVPSYQRKKETGRPADMYVFDSNHVDEMTADKYSEITPYTFNYGKYVYYLPLPVWANIRYNIIGWEKYETTPKKPEWPYAEDLQYPANEYYYDKDRKAWCHPKLQYPAREYYKDSKGNWVHDASCPWDKPYIYKD